MNQIVFPECANDRRQPSGIVKILHQEASGGHQVYEGGDFSAEMVPVIERDLQADASGYCEQVNDSIGRATHRAIHANSILECVTSQNLRDAQIVPNHFDNSPACGVSKG